MADFVRIETSVSRPVKIMDDRNDVPATSSLEESQQSVRKHKPEQYARQDNTNIRILGLLTQRAILHVFWKLISTEDP